MEEDLIPYPLLAAEFPRVTLDRDTPAIKDKIVPQGHMEDTATQNTNFAPLDFVAGVDGPAVVNTPMTKSSTTMRTMTS